LIKFILLLTTLGNLKGFIRRNALRLLTPY
jgi:hypothetical protein